MIIYAGSFPIAGGSQDAVRQALATAREQTLAEDGCHAYEFGFDVDDPTRVVFHELYDDRSAFDAHMQADHTRALFKALGDHLAGRASGQMYAAELVRRDGGG